MSKYEIRSDLISIPPPYENVIGKTLEMYDNGEDISNSPIIQSGINKTHADCYHGMSLMDRQNKTISLYKDIRDNGYKDSPILVWFDEEGYIHLYDGYHRLSVLKYLNKIIKVTVETSWNGIDGSKGGDFPLEETLKSTHPYGKWTYQPVFDQRLIGWNVARPDSPDRLKYLLTNLEGGAVIDLGCSEGYFCMELAKRGYSVLGIDNDPKLVSVARYLSIINNYKITYICGDWEKILNNCTHFDNILFLSIIHNDMKKIGVENGINKLKSLKNKSNKVFLEVPNNSGEKEWMREGFPDFDFHKNKDLIGEKLGLSCISQYDGTRKIYLYSSEDNIATVQVDDINGYSMILPKDEHIITSHIIKEKVWEPELTSWLKQNVKEGNTFVDIGAHVGYFSLLASKLVGSAGKVISYEPDINNFKLLCKNIELNNSDNITPINKAISNTEGQQKLYSYAGKTDTGRKGLTPIENRNEAVRKRHPEYSNDVFNLVETTRLTGIIPDFIKIDVEGGERDTLLGIVDCIGKNTKIIVEDENEEDVSWVENNLGLKLNETLYWKKNILRDHIYSKRSTALEEWMLPERSHYQPLFDYLKIHKCKNIMEIGVWKGETSRVIIKAASELVPEEEINYYGFDIFEDRTQAETEAEYSPIIPSRPAALRVKGKNFGDLLNIPILKHYFSGIEFKTIDEIKSKQKVLVGAGTLIGYVMPDEWYKDKDITFLGTGSRDEDIPFKVKSKGFTRGKLTEKKTGIKALGDIGLLIDKIFPVNYITFTRTEIGVCLDKTDKKFMLPSIQFSAYGIEEDDIENLCKDIASFRYIITDRLHVAVAAESYHVPWVLVNHGETTLDRTPDKFRDWAEMIDKERFIITELNDWEIVKENTNFDKSEGQKAILENELERVHSQLSPHTLDAVKHLLGSETKANINLFKGDTRNTLPSAVQSLPKMDLIYIDGGHAIDTIRNDWEWSKKLMDEHTVVFLDDYCDEMPFMGARFMVHELGPEYGYQICEPANYYKRAFGRFKSQLLKVWKKKKSFIIKRDHYRFHLLGLPHSKTTKEWVLCPFTQLAYKFSKMLTDMGHEVVHYGAEGSNPVCSENVTVLTEATQKEAYGDWDPAKQLWIHNGQDLAYRTFRKNAIEEINMRKEPKDFLLITNGHWLKEIADKTNIMAVEPFVGYIGYFSKYKVFPSYAWMHHLYGIAIQRLKQTNPKENFSTGNWYDSVIPHFFDHNDFKFNQNKDDYFLYCGRLITRKGCHIAAQVCKEIGAKLKVIGQVLDPNKLEASLKQVGLLEPHVEYLGTVDRIRRNELMGKAKAVFVPSLYMEPFGKVVVEALLCGTPVITTDWGSFPEIVKQGEVGYRCRTMDDFVWAANNVDKLDYKYCREYAINNYSIERISKAYQEYFMKLHDLFSKGWYAKHNDRTNLDWIKRY